MVRELKVANKTMPIQSLKLQEALGKYQDLQDQVAQLTIEGKQESLVSTLLKLCEVIDETCLLVTKIKKEEQSRSEASGSFYNTIAQKLLLDKTDATYQRNLLQAHLIASQIDLNDGIFSPIEKKGLSKDSRPQNVIRFLEKALKASRSNTAIVRELFQDEADQALIGEFKELDIETQIAYFVTLSYANEKAYFEAVQLSKHAIEQVRSVQMFVEKTKIQDKTVTSQLQNLEQIHANLKKILVKMHAKYLAEQANEKKKTENAFASQSDLIEPDLKKAQNESLYATLYD